MSRSVAAAPLLLERGAWSRALLYALASLGLCIGGATVGMTLARTVSRAVAVEATPRT